MRDQVRDQLNTEITRKQFLQYLAAAALALFGLNNLLSLLTGNHRDVQRIFVNSGNSEATDGFGSRKFGV